MSAQSSMPWQALLSPPGFEASAIRRARLVRRAGEPFLLLPLPGRAASRGLELYPAQTGKARLLRGVLRGMLRFGLAPGTQPVTMALAPDCPFVRFLSEGRSWGDLQLALLLGNPRAPGRRFVLLVMDPHGAPLHVVKAGTDTSAVALIEKEAAILKSHTHHRLHSPQVRSELLEGTVAAISMSHAAGQPPRAASESQIGDVLEGWLNHGSQFTFSNFPQGRRLLASGGLSPVERQLLARLESQRIAGAIHHGDFAPWNIREEPGSGRWTVLDWERGESQGPPAWDWFHFWVQTAVLVERLQPEAILARLEEGMQLPRFQRYAKAAGITGMQSGLLLGYLLHAREVVHQTEGAEVIRTLAHLMTTRLAGRD